MKGKTTKYLISLRLTSVKKASLRSIILFCPNTGKGNFPNQTLPFPRVAGSMRVAPCLLSAPKTAFACSTFDCRLFPCANWLSWKAASWDFWFRNLPSLEDGAISWRILPMTVSLRRQGSTVLCQNKFLSLWPFLRLSWAPQPRRWSDNLTLSPNKGDQTLQEMHR